MEIIRNDDGTLTVPVEPDRQAVEAAAESGETLTATTMTLHPGEGGYDEALSEWDLQQHDGQAAVSTASGREAAMHVIHEVAADPDIDIADADRLQILFEGGVHMDGVGDEFLDGIDFGFAFIDGDDLHPLLVQGFRQVESETA